MPTIDIEKTIELLEQENLRLRQWVRDLQSGMYVNCVYCGHRYGPKDEVPTSMAEVLKQHIEQCPKHPMSELKAEIEMLKSRLAEDNSQHQWAIGLAILHPDGNQTHAVREFVGCEGDANTAADELLAEHGVDVWVKLDE